MTPLRNRGANMTNQEYLKELLETAEQVHGKNAPVSKWVRGEMLKAQGSQAQSRSRRLLVGRRKRV